MWNFIPQLFYDFLARVLPGAIIIIVSAAVILGPSYTAKYILDPDQNDKLFAFGPLLLWITGSYLTGFILGQLWQDTIQQLIKKKEKNLEKERKQKRLNEHNKILRALKKPQLEITPDDLPREFVMREHIRQVKPSEAARLLKVRAEIRLCQVLILGFLLLWLINIVYLLLWLKEAYESVAERIILAILLPIAVLACWTRAKRLYSHFVDGISVTWLIHASSGEFPIQTSINKKSEHD